VLWTHGALPRVRAGCSGNFEPRLVNALYNAGTILAGRQRRLLTGGMPRMMKLEFVAGAMIAAATAVVG
jgi:hypothetical protein